MKVSRRPITLQRDTSHDGVTFWRLTDENLHTVYCFLNFIIDCIDVQALRPKTVEGRAYSLKKWHQFLSDAGVEIFDANDEILMKFRSHLLERVAVNHSGDAQAHRRTINLDLRNIYTYYAWLQLHDVGCQDKRLLGIDACQITSSLLVKQTIKATRSDRHRYPATFRNAGERSKHRLGFVPREEHRARLTEYFYDTHSLGISARNCLIFELAWSVGWRRGSILSLLIEQFSRTSVLEGDESDPLSICPPTQKFGYSNSFPIEYGLAQRVVHYIENERDQVIRRTNSKFSEIFLNDRTGIPLTAGAVSGIFNTARHALGWPAGAGLHGWRRGFANAYIEREVDARIELGLDTGAEAIAMSLATALGQENLASQAAYLRDAQRRIRGTATFRDKVEHARIADENAALRAEIASLRQKMK